MVDFQVLVTDLANSQIVLNQSLSFPNNFPNNRVVFDLGIGPGSYNIYYGQTSDAVLDYGYSYEMNLDYSYAATVVPLPAAAWLFLSGMTSLLLVCRKNRRA